MLCQNILLFFFLLPCHVTVCRLTCHVVLGGSYQEAVQTKPGFPGSASNTANTLCSDTGGLRETHWTCRKIRAITVAGHVCSSGVSFANLVFKVNMSHGLWQQWCMRRRVLSTNSNQRKHLAVGIFNLVWIVWLCRIFRFSFQLSTQHIVSHHCYQKKQKKCILKCVVAQ